MLGLEQLQLPLDEVDIEAPSHVRRLLLRVCASSSAAGTSITGGRTRSRARSISEMVRLVTADADVVALQEVPLWAVKRLDDWSGMSASWAMTMPTLLGPLARHLAAADPVRFRSSLTGGERAARRPRFELGRHRRAVLNPGLARGLAPPRRPAAGVPFARGRGGRPAPGARQPACVERPRPAGSPMRSSARSPSSRVPSAASCGDFNVRRHPVAGFSGRSTGSTRSSSAGQARARAGPGPRRRRVQGAVLSDHAPSRR